ncbi:MAG: hypothetical protein APR63_08260 [Desulfuromonas sp. SDB]|nr:MAG: hypothetical protein APR63_08260 [Desulfuromonas sp. SDB]
MDKLQLIEKLKNSKLAIIGAGRSGIAAAKLLKGKGLEVFVSDHGKLSLHARQQLEALNIPWEEGMHSSKLDDCRILIVSPGVNPNHEFLREVRKKDVEIITEIEIGWAWLQGKLVAITGTNGKSTTTALLGEILKAAKLGGEIGGNLAPGKPLSELANQSQPHKWICAEVSSFQMELVKYFKPDAVIWTNLSPDHLDRHKDINEYAELKMDLVNRTSDSGFVVLNGDDPIISKLTEKLDKQKLYFGHNEHPQFYSFLDDQGIIFIPDIIIPYSDIQLRGEHNFENIMAAGTAALKIGVNPDELKQGIRNFSGLPHRLEIVGEVEGVTFINNSMCTNEAAFERSLETFPHSTVIAGGHPKNTDLYRIAEILNDLASQVVLLGKSSSELAKHLNNLGKTYKIAEDIDQAVYISFQLSNKGEVVLLNPGMASFDLFIDFLDRGDKFKQAVSNLRRTVNCA